MCMYVVGQTCHAPCGGQSLISLLPPFCGSWELELGLLECQVPDLSLSSSSSWQASGHAASH